MNPARAQSWSRFHDQAILRAPEWPRELWFPAVEDALAAALGAGAREVEDHRRNVAELRRAERQAGGSPADEARIARLTAQIRRRIGAVDATMREQAPPPGSPENADASPPAGPSFRAPRWVGIAGRVAFGLAMFGAGVLSTSYVFESRLAAQLDRRLAAFEEDLGRRASQIGPGGAAGERTQALHDELAGRIREFSAIMAQTVAAMAALRENTVAELERRLDERGGDIARRLGDLHQQADLLGRGLDQVSRQLAGFEQRLPGLGDRLDGLAVQLEQASFGPAMAESMLAGSAGKVDRIGLSGAGARGLLDAERDTALAALAQAREAHLAGLAEEMAATRAELDRTRERLVAGWESLDRTVSERQEEMLAGIEEHAARIEARVEEFVRALDGMLAPPGPESGPPAAR